LLASSGHHNGAASDRESEKEKTMLERIAVGTDGSETAEKAVDFAIDLAEKYGSQLVVASSYRPVGEDRVRKDQEDAPQDIQWSINPTQDVDATLRAAEEKAKKRGLKTTSEAREGDPADVLCEIAEQHGADLLVVGNKGMQRRILGSVPNSVSHKAPCSVVIVKTT
jgi:nucleotide-binding universal stress UspA family protein